MTILEKLSNIQAELKAPKSQYNEFGKYNYRNCEDILEAVKPICKKYGTVLYLTDQVVNIGERYYIEAKAILNDIDNEGETCLIVTAYAREEESKKGMDGSQVTGASSSYARKYALNGLFNIDDTKDSDTTNKGNSAPERPQNGNRSNAPQQQPRGQAQGGQNSDAQHTAMTLEQAREYAMTKGKHANVRFKNVPLDYLKWVSEKLTGRAAEAARLIIQDERDRDREEPYEDDDLGEPPFDLD